MWTSMLAQPLRSPVTGFANGIRQIASANLQVKGPQSRRPRTVPRPSRPLLRGPGAREASRGFASAWVGETSAGSQ